MSATPPPASVTLDTALNGKRLLIVEDDPVITHVYVRQFRAAGCIVESASDGILAMDVLEKFTPDVIILDLQMPKVNGIGVLKFVRARTDTAKVPVIVFSNAYLGALVESAWQAGATKCLSKAVTTPKQLLNAIKITLADAAAQKSAAPGAPPSPVAASVASAPAAPVPVVPSVTPAPVVAAPAPVAAVVVSAPAAQVVTPVVETKAAATFQAEVSQSVLDKAPDMIRNLHAQMNALIHPEATGKLTLDRGAKLQNFFESTRSLTGQAGLAGWRRMASLSSAFEAFLRDLDEHAEHVTDSTIHTLKSTVEALITLSAHVDQPESEGENIVSVLIVHGDAAARKTLTASLDKQTMKGVAVDDGGMALNIASKVDFKLVIAAADMVGMGMQEFHGKLRGSPRHRRTPLIFVAGTTGLKPAQAQTLGVSDDWISHPFPAIELTVKSMASLFKSQVVELAAKKP